MLTATDKKHLQQLLAMTSDPDNTFSYDELLGYLFGLAITPEALMPNEWIPLIFGGDLPEFASLAVAQKMTGGLMTAYNKYIDEFQKGQLTFPFTIENLHDDQFAEVYEWVSGFEEAIALREELWDPEEYPDLSDEKKEELYHSIMSIQGLVDPVEAMEYFEDMPDEVFQEAFSGLDTELDDREAQIQIFLLASLPLAIETFLDHARVVEKKRQQHLSKTRGPIPLRSAKIGRNDPCPCGSGKKFKKCCGSNIEQQPIFPGDMSPKKNNVIQVDFPQHGKKKPAAAPIYQLKVDLQEAEPPIWRRIQVPGNITLDRLHTVLQLCMDWEDQHLHQFLIDRTCYSIPSDDDFRQTSRPKNEAHYTLHQLVDKIQPQFQYIYDFGDNWIHQITVEKVLPDEKGKPCPVLLAGQRACPIEDIGGIHNYMHILEVLKDREHEEYEEIAAMLNLDIFEPERFDQADIEEINSILQELFS